MAEEEPKKVKILFFRQITCPHCAIAWGYIRNAQKIYKNDIEIMDIDVDSQNGQLLSQLHNVMGTPTIFINGELKFQGEPQSESSLFDEIEKYLDDQSIERAKINKRRYQERINMIYS